MILNWKPKNKSCLLYLQLTSFIKKWLLRYQNKCTHFCDFSINRINYFFVVFSTFRIYCKSLYSKMTFYFPQHLRCYLISPIWCFVSETKSCIWIKFWKSSIIVFIPLWKSIFWGFIWMKQRKGFCRRNGASCFHKYYFMLPG